MKHPSRDQAGDYIGQVGQSYTIAIRSALVPQVVIRAQGTWTANASTLTCVRVVRPDGTWLLARVVPAPQNTQDLEQSQEFLGLSALSLQTAATLTRADVPVGSTLWCIEEPCGNRTE